ncbi:PQQ-binding-like beta-propeller repeat protein [Mucisphaera sp.]|uniref:outer membrane protein assembly factor BamB family protein n=1 Tax=Mucisphaera sp. TaxID=2913024 RepID=UPI003D148F3E
MRISLPRLAFWLVLLVFSLPAAAQVSAVYVPENRDAEDLIGDMGALEERGRLEAAARVLHRLLSMYPDALIEVEPGRYVRVRALIWEGTRVSSSLEAVYARLYEGESANLRAGLPSGRDGLEALAKHFDLYRPTREGLRAGLDLAGLYLEAGRLRDAEALLGVIDRLALPGELLARYASLRSAVRELSVWAGSSGKIDVRSTPEGGVFPGPAGDALALDEVAALWSVAWEDLIDEQLAAWLSSSQPEVRVFTGQRRSPRGGYPIPVIADDLVLVHTGRSLVGLDRFSGFERWRVVSEASLPDGELPNRLRALVQPVIGAGLAVGEGRAYAIFGSGLQRPTGIGMRQQAEGISGQSLVAVDLVSGEVLWRQNEDELVEDGQDWSLVGTPMLAQGRVYAVLQRIQAGSLAETRVACWDAETGEPGWMRGVGTIGIARGMASQSQPSLGFHADSDRVLLVDPSGLLVALASASGSIAWLRDLSQLDDRGEGVSGRVASRVPQASRPRLLALPEGVLVAPTDQSVIRLLAIEDGRLLAELEPGSMPARFHWTEGGLLLSAGTGAEWFDERLMPVDPGDTGEALAAGAIWFEHGGWLWSIDRAGAEPTRRMVLDPAARIAGHREQVLVSGPEGLQVFMAWPLARAKLLDALASPAAEGLEPGLRLMEVASGQGDRSAIQEGLVYAERVWGAWQGQVSPSEREAVFRRLARLVGSLLEEDAAIGLRCVALLEGLTVSTEHRAAVLILIARLQSALGRADLGVAAYQALLQGSEFTGVQLGYLDGAPLAARVARREVRRLVGEVGSEVYSRFDALALTELEAARDRGSSEGLAAVAERYPASRWARPALELAGQLALRQGRPLDATMYLRRAYRLVETADQAVALVEQVSMAHLAMGLPERTGVWLRRLSRDFPAWDGVLRLGEEGAGVARAASRELVWPGFPTRGWRLTGLALERAHGADHAVIRHQQVLSSWRADSVVNQPFLAGRVVLEARPLVVISDRRGFVATLQTDGSVVHLNHDDPSSGWTRQRLTADPESPSATTIPRPVLGRPEAVRELVVPPMAIDRALPTVLIPGLTDFRVIVSSQQGRVSALDRRDGQPVWHQQARGGTLLGLEVNEWFAALHGRQRPGQGGPGSWIDVFDTLSGEPVLLNLQPAQPIVDLRLTELDQMAVIEGRELVVYGLPDGQVTWRRTIEQTAFQRPLWVAGGFLAVHSVRANVNSLRVYETESGRELVALSSATRTNESSPPIRALGDEVIVRSSDRLMKLDSAGRVVWEAAAPSGAGGVAAEGLRHMAHWLSEDRVLVWSLGISVRGQAAVSPIWSEYDLASGRLLDRRALPADWRQADLSASGPIEGGFVVALRGAGTILLMHDAGDEGEAPGLPVVLHIRLQAGEAGDREPLFLPRPQGTLRMPR